MRVIAILLFSVLYAVTVAMEPNNASELNMHGPTDHIARNQLKRGAITPSADHDELIRLTRLDGLDLSKSGWTHKEVAICPAFTHHFFVRYKNTGAPNADFIAVYPRKIGNIHIIRQGNGPTTASRVASIRPVTISTFNAVLAEERRSFGFKMPMPESIWIDLANCYAEVAGERPAKGLMTLSLENTDKMQRFDVTKDPYLIIGIEVLGDPSKKTDLAIEFNRSGFIKHVIRTESNQPSDLQ